MIYQTTPSLINPRIRFHVELNAYFAYDNYAVKIIKPLKREEFISMYHALSVAAGGCLGALSRYYLVNFVASFGFLSFPVGTLLVNASGCFMIGILFEISQKMVISPITSALLFTGFLGSFTTFSAFSLQTIQLLRAGNLQLAGMNIVSHLSLGFAATYIGMKLASNFWS